MDSLCQMIGHCQGAGGAGIVVEIVCVKELPLGANLEISMIAKKES